MFDTSIVRAQAVVGPRRAALFTASIAIHSAAVVGAILMTLTSTTFPRMPPNQMEILRPVSFPFLPPPLGHPARPPLNAAVTPPLHRSAPIVPAQVTAPQLPDSTPVLATTSGPLATSSATGEAVADGGPIGDPDGVPGGVGDTPGAVAGDGSNVTYTPGGDVTTARVLSRVEPRYPQAMINNRIPATVKIRCIIDRNGRVRDAEILKSSFPPFNQSVIDALQQWTFVPGTMRGEAVDTWFELTVRFQVR